MQTTNQLCSCHQRCSRRSCLATLDRRSLLSGAVILEPATNWTLAAARGCFEKEGTLPSSPFNPVEDGPAMSSMKTLGSLFCPRRGIPGIYVKSNVVLARTPHRVVSLPVSFRFSTPSRNTCLLFGHSRATKRTLCTNIGDNKHWWHIRRFASSLVEQWTFLSFFFSLSFPTGLSDLLTGDCGVRFPVERMKRRYGL